MKKAPATGRKYVSRSSGKRGYTGTARLKESGFLNCLHSMWIDPCFSPGLDTVAGTTKALPTWLCKEDGGTTASLQDLRQA